MAFSEILKKFNINALNQMQEETIAAYKKSDDLIIISPTGSGKTLAFLLPTLTVLNSDKKEIQVVIIVPTRELALQIESVFKQMGTAFKINCCYGGHSVGIERNNLTEPPAILVGTPGRIAHHIRKKTLHLNNANYLILDEFDKSLEAGFEEEISFIIKTMKQINKRILTSATQLKEIPKFVGLKEFVNLNFSENNQTSNSGLALKFVRVSGDDKLEALMLLISKIGQQATIVFCNHRDAVIRISEQLTLASIAHGFYHGGLDQIEREKTLIKLRNGSTNFLISTDLAARGIDIPEIKVIIHYQLPGSEDIMIHRNGRTARMNESGTAYFLLDQDDYLPSYILIKPEEEILPEKRIAFKPCEWQTLYISAGKKDKVNKMDIVGMLLQKGGLKKEDLGKIEVLDHSAYVAVKKDKIFKTLQLIKDERIKNKKVKTEIST